MKQSLCLTCKDIDKCGCTGRVAVTTCPNYKENEQ
jgi:hypothetical protein